MSCSSAVSVYGALTDSGHRVVPVGIDRHGAWFLADTAYKPFRAEGRPVSFSVPEGVLEVSGEQVEFDVVFPVLHGPMGEDGTVQGLFDMSGVPYVGCGVRASALTMDKDFTKRIAKAAGIDTSPWFAVKRDRWDGDASGTAATISAQLRYPMFVKPSAQGSSVGISKVTDADALHLAINTAFRYDTKVVVEEAIEGREIEISVIDGPRASVPGEIVTDAEWYTYSAKYGGAGSECVVPADLDAHDTATVRSLAERVFDLFALSGLARIDFFLDGRTGRFLFNEVNTMPGFTSISGFPKMWLASGFSYEELCSRLVDAAFQRHATRSKLETR